MFQNREDAGRQLATVLMQYADEKPFILALPRGGVPVAAEVARALDAPLDILIVRKLGAPGQPELAIGAVAEGYPPYVFWNEGLAAEIGVSDAYRAAVYKDQLQSIEKRRACLAGAGHLQNITGRNVILVDDGIATGATIRVAIEAIKAQQPLSLCLAVPVAPPETLEAMRALADDIVCLEAPSFFRAVGCHYEDFAQTTDDEVRDVLAELE